MPAGRHARVALALATALALAGGGRRALAAGSRDATPVNLLPVGGGTTDVGAGVGEFAGITRVRPGYEPYVWNVESAGLITFKPREGGGVLRSLSGHLRAARRAAPLRTGVGAPRARLPIIAHAAAHVSVRYTQNWIDVPAASKLAEDMRGAEGAVRTLLGSATQPHGVALFSYGVEWDDRDSEVSPHHGSFDEATVRLSPGGTEFLPYRYGEATVDARLFAPLRSRRLTIALRAVGDVLFGDPPFYALPRVDEDYAIGGLNGVRGVPAERYSGKAKTFGSAEVRADVAAFRALGKRMLSAPSRSSTPAACGRTRLPIPSSTGPASG